MTRSHNITRMYLCPAFSYCGSRRYRQQPKFEQGKGRHLIIVFHSFRRVCSKTSIEQKVSWIGYLTYTILLSNVLAVAMVP